MYFLLPLHEQFDSGFGAIGDTYFKAGTTLASDKKFSPLENRYLPICYLFRHGIELYLKSIIIVLHRKFNIPNPDGSAVGDFPKIKLPDNKCQSLSIHSVACLGKNVRRLLESCRSDLQKLSARDFSFKLAFYDALAQVDDWDGKSDYFRYPISKQPSKDGDKTSMQPISPADLAARVTSDPSKVQAFLEADEKGGVMRAFQLSSKPMDEIYQMLARLIGCLYEFHADLRGEISGNR